MENEDKIPALKFAGDMARPYPPHLVVFQYNFNAVYRPLPAKTVHIDKQL